MSISKEELRQQLLAQLAALDTQVGDVELPTSRELPISSPALEQEYNSNINVGDNVCFIYSRLEVVPATIIKTHAYDNTYDIVAYIPSSVVKLKWKNQKQGLDRVETIDLVERHFPKVRLSDPRMTFRKQMIPLADAQTVDGRTQTHYDIFSPVLEPNTTRPRLQQVPRFHEFHTNIVSTIFDPSIYNFNVVCFRGKREIDKNVFSNQVQETYPKKKMVYEIFTKAFDRFYKEYYLGRGKANSKWDSVQIVPTLREL